MTLLEFHAYLYVWLQASAQASNLSEVTLNLLNVAFNLREVTLNLQDLTANLPNTPVILRNAPANHWKTTYSRKKSSTIPLFDPKTPVLV